jgi:hypothetical protein
MRTRWVYDAHYNEHDLWRGAMRLATVRRSDTGLWVGFIFVKEPTDTAPQASLRRAKLLVEAVLTLEGRV